MGTVELRSKLIDLIKDMDNENLLKAIYVMITHKPVPSHKGLKWEELPETQQSEIEEGIEQAENEEVLGHDKVMNKYKKWL